MNEVVGYTDFSTDEYVVSGPKGAAKTTSSRPERFFFNSNLSICPFCRTKVYRVYHAAADLVWGMNGYEANVVHECSSCRWWQYDYTWECEGPGWELDDFEKRKYRGIAKRFDVASATIPINILNEEAAKRPDILYDSHHRKFEELVGYVFGSYYNCDVVHCGRSNDGGVDLIVIDADNPLLIQVKRRFDPNATEKISAVREFLGAMTMRQARRGAFVTTAKRFSRATQADAATLVEKLIVDQFDLFDFKRFIDMLRIAGSKQFRPWERLVRMLEVETEGAGTLNLFIDCYDADSRRKINREARRLIKTLPKREPQPAFGSREFRKKASSD